MSSKDLFCVWSGKRLTEKSLDIDHCFPWSAWACDDLWNLMPADRRVNQHQKRDRLVAALRVAARGGRLARYASAVARCDRLPGAEILRSAQERVQSWWDEAYIQTANSLIPRRFVTEARASLPGLLYSADTLALDDLFAAVMLQRAKLKHDQQVPEWSG
nr:HNH endonuclease domain-containing protein [Leptolyngbya ohadii]